MGRIDAALVPVFARQHWLATRADVFDHGGGDDMIARRLMSGRWEAADRGVYRLAGMPTTWESTVLAPILASGGAAVASHFTAAALHGMSGFGRGVPEITVPREADRRRDRLRVHTSTDLARCTIVLRHGIPTTDVHRTLLDLGRFVGDQRLLRAIEGARRTGTTDWPKLIATLSRHARRGRPGIRRLRRVIVANMQREAVTDSDFELLVLALLAEAGLPAPALHHQVMDGGRFVAEVDLAYPDLRIAIELDGSVHLERDVHERDLQRQNDLVLLGWTILRFTWDRLQQRPDRIVAEVRDAIVAAQPATPGSASR